MLQLQSNNASLSPGPHNLSDVSNETIKQRVEVWVEWVFGGKDLSPRWFQNVFLLLHWSLFKDPLRWNLFSWCFQHVFEAFFSWWRTFNEEIRLKIASLSISLFKLWCIRSRRKNTVGISFVDTTLRSILMNPQVWLCFSRLSLNVTLNHTAR